jgi:hypothetical protein
MLGGALYMIIMLRQGEIELALQQGQIKPSGHRRIKQVLPVRFFTGKSLLQFQEDMWIVFPHASYTTDSKGLS